MLPLSELSFCLVTNIKLHQNYVINYNRKAIFFSAKWHNASQYPSPASSLNVTHSSNPPPAALSITNPPSSDKQKPPSPQGTFLSLQYIKTTCTQGMTNLPTWENVCSNNTEGKIHADTATTFFAVLLAVFALMFISFRYRFVSQVVNNRDSVVRAVTKRHCWQTLTTYIVRRYTHNLPICIRFVPDQWLLHTHNISKAIFCNVLIVMAATVYNLLSFHNASA